MIKYILIVADRIIASQYQKFKVASLIERIIKNKPQREQSFYKYKNINLNGEITAYVEFLVYLLKKEGKNTKKYINILLKSRHQYLYQKLFYPLKTPIQRENLHIFF